MGPVADPKSLTDEQLLAEYAQTQDGRLFEELYTRYYGVLHRWLCRYFDENVDRAEDVLQTVFVRVHERSDRYDVG